MWYPLHVVVMFAGTSWKKVFIKRFLNKSQVWGELSAADLVEGLVERGILCVLAVLVLQIWPILQLALPVFRAFLRG